MLLAGLGVGALASQLGSVTVSSVPDEQSGEVGGVQNTMTNLGASIGTALAGAVLISALTTSFLTGVQNNPDVPPRPHLPGAGGTGRRNPVPVRQGPPGPPPPRRSATR
jgi:MFS family permease